jgi:hypothetical protein
MHLLFPLPNLILSFFINTLLSVPLYYIHSISYNRDRAERKEGIGSRVREEGIGGKDDVDNFPTLTNKQYLTSHLTFLVSAGCKFER